MTHIDEMTHLQYLDGLLDGERAREVSRHTDECPACRQLQRALERESRLLSVALREQDEPVPARLLSPVLRERMPWAWIVSFGLAAAGVYWLWSSVIDPWQERFQSAGLGETDLLTTLLFGGQPWNWWQGMWSAMQALAVISLAVVGFYALRRSLRRWHTVALVMPVLALGLLSPGARAVEVHHHQASYVLPAGSVIHDDLLCAGQTMRIDGTVEGDVICAGTTLTIGGHVMGDVLFAGTTLNILGTVDGNVRGAGTNLNISGKVARNVMFFGSSVELASNGEIGQDLLTFGGQLSVEGRVGRDLYGHVGQVSVEGTIGRNADLHVNDTLVVGPSAEFHGKTELKARRQPDIAPGAKFASPMDVVIQTTAPRYRTGRYFWHLALSWGAAFVFGVLWIALLPSLFPDITRRTESFGSFGLGILLLIAVPIVAIIVCVTVVGIPIGIASVFLWLILVYSAKIFVSTWLGQKMLGATMSTGGLIARMAVGLVVIYAAEEIPYHVGGVVWFVVVCLGIGAFCTAAYRHIHPASPAALAPPPIIAPSPAS
jgi:anti-sigma factor RsiW/cytoskeletal protein CcmA (bactofilin family)